MAGNISVKAVLRPSRQQLNTSSMSDIPKPGTIGAEECHTPDALPRHCLPHT
jgi:hypothetical protein